MKKFRFNKSFSKRSLAVLVCVAMFLSMFFTMSAIASTTIIAPTELTADKWGCDSRLNISAVDNGVIKVSNAATYDSAIWPTAETEITVDLDKVPYFYYEISETNTPLTIYLSLGDTRADLQGNNWGGAEGVQKQIVSISEKLGVTGIQTFKVVFQWLSGDALATEVGQRNIVFSQLGLTDAAGKAVFEGTALTAPTELAADKWGCDSRLSVSAVDNGVIKVSNAATYDSAIWPEAEAEVTADLDKIPYFCYEVDQTNTPYSIYLEYNDVKTYIQGSQYGGVPGKTAGVISIKDTLNLSGVQTFSIGLHWLTGETYATEVGQRNIVFSQLGLTDEAGKADFENRNTIVKATRIPIDGFVWDANRITVEIAEDGYGFTTSIPGSAVVPYAEITKEITVDLDKVPYLYVDVANLDVEWKVKFSVNGTVYSGDPGLSENNLPNGAVGLHRFNIAKATGLTGVQTIGLMIYMVDSDYEMTAGSTNMFNGLYVDGAEFSFDAPQAIADTAILDPSDFRYVKSMLELKTDGNGYTMSIIPPSYPSWQTANMGLTIDFDKIRYLCLNIPECIGDIEVTITDIENNERYVLAKEKKEYKGTMMVDLAEKPGFTGVKTVVLSVTYTDGTYKQMLTVDNMYLTTADFKVPDGIENLTDVTPGDNDDQNNENQDNSNNNNDNDTNNDDKTPDTGVTDSALPMLMLVMAAAVVVIGKRRRACN